MPPPLSGGPPSFSRSRYDGPPARMREDPPLPTEPPFTAFVVNLAFESTEEDVRAFFDPMNALSVRLVKGHDGRPRGYGYVEFATLDELKDALTFTGKPMQGRNVRVSVAESPSRGSRHTAADDATQWRRAAPLPPSSRDSGISGFDNMSISSDGGRQGFGGRFTHITDSPRRRGQMVPAEPIASDMSSSWRTGKPVVSKSRFGFGNQEGSRGRRNDDLDFSSWRKPSAEGNAPTERRKLELKPRSEAPRPSTDSPASGSARSNPFGAAKPVDINERHRQIDEKIRENDKLLREELKKEDERKKNKGGFFKARASDAWSTNEPNSDAPTRAEDVPSQETN